ncbi:hypothetical protein BY458DRAFT_525951 [Sporodiniella umbellata]|nr:hypothetical protein BY458DRAFT_525951 [Sporodiniella umbellata]
MRIFWHSGKDSEPLELLQQTGPSKNLLFPTEIIRKIVEYLPRSCLPSIAGINHTWYALAMPALYRHIYIRTYQHWMLLQRSFENKDFAKIFGSYVTSIVLKPSPKLVSSRLANAISVKAIENDDKLQPNTRGYVRLERIDYNLTGLEEIEKATTESQVDTSKKEAEWLSFVTDNQVNCILDFCCNIEYLYLSGCENLSDYALVPVYKQKLQQGNQKTTKLKGLWLNLARNITATTLINLANVDRMSGKSELRYLDLEFVISLTDGDIERILSHFGPSLIHLQFNSAYELTNASATSISKYCPKLKLLYLTRCWRINNEGLANLSKNCKQLSDLSVSFLGSVNEEGLGAFVRSGALTRLNITGCGISALFKHLIIASWTAYRVDNRLLPLSILDESLNLI